MAPEDPIGTRDLARPAGGEPDTARRSDGRDIAAQSQHPQAAGTDTNPSGSQLSQHSRVTAPGTDLRANPPASRLPQHSRIPRLAPDRADARFLRRLVYLIVVAAVVLAIWRATNLLILAFGATLGALVIHAVADAYADHLRLGRRRSLIAGYVTVLAVIGFLGWLFGVAFRAQVNVLVTQLPGLLDQLAAWASQSPVGAKIVDAVRQAYAGSRVAQDVGGLVTGGGELLLNCLLLLVGALFLAADPKVYERGFLLLIPRAKRPVFEDALFDVGTTLRLWLRSSLILMTSMGVMIGVGLWLSDVPSAAALGLLAGLSEFIPYVGPTAAMIPALGLAATKGHGALIGTLVTYAVVRLIQTNFITPYVQKRVIAIPPAITVFAIIGVGVVFGIFGLFFSAALLVVFFTLVRSLYLREVLGEDIPRAPHERLFGPDGARRDKPQSLKSAPTDAGA